MGKRVMRLDMAKARRLQAEANKAWERVGKSHKYADAARAKYDKAYQDYVKAVKAQRAGKIRSAAKAKARRAKAQRYLERMEKIERAEYNRAERVQKKQKWYWEHAARPGK